MYDFICANCKHGKKYKADCEWEYMYDGTDYANDCCDWWKPTNADRIRSMGDEELATLLNDAESDGRVYGPRGKVAWEKWLRQECDP